MKAQDTIDRVTELLEQGQITGVMDDRGKFIYISQVSDMIKVSVKSLSNTLLTKSCPFGNCSFSYFQEELESIAKFIKQRGRVSISELAENSNKLISLNS